MGVMIMMPRWEDATSGWMPQMLQNISQDLAAIAVDDSSGNNYWQNSVRVISLSPRARQIRGSYRLLKGFGLALTKIGPERDNRLQTILREPSVSRVFCQYGTYAVKFMDVWRKTDIPLFIHFHGYDATFDLRSSDDPQRNRFPPDYLANIKELSRRATFIANSRFTKSLLLDEGISPDRVLIKYFGIPLPEKKHIHEKKAGVKILHLGRLVDFKSPDRTIQAFEIAKSKGLDGDLILAGDGPLRACCELVSLRSPYKEAIHILGNVNSDTAKQLLTKSDIFTQHNIQGEISRQSECFGVSIVEAMASGLPVVGTQHGGVLETVVDGETGFLNEPGDVDAQAGAFLELARNPDLRQKMGDAGQKRVATFFTPQQEIDRLRSIMKI
jgi:glycosyltransferase involved in cell wall biosynthesis